MKSICIGMIWLYQHSLSLLLPNHCRFYPSCSAYAKEAIAVKGVWRGSLLATRRILKCHPWHVGGWDPVTRPLTRSLNRLEGK